MGRGQRSGWGGARGQVSFCGTDMLSNDEGRGRVCFRGLLSVSAGQSQSQGL